MSLPGSPAVQPPLCPPEPPQQGEMELNLFCIRLRSTRRLKNNKEKAKPSAIITSL